MIKLYDSAFSPFARKVRMVLDYKNLNYEAVDGLLRSNHDALKAVNGRIEVPVLVDRDIVVVNSPDSRLFGTSLPNPERLSTGARCPRSRSRLGAVGRHIRGSDLCRYFLLEVGQAAGPNAARSA